MNLNSEGSGLRLGKVLIAKLTWRYRGGKLTIRSDRDKNLAM